jgi:biotin carboxylase
MNEAPALFCIASYEKGQPFLREAARLGARLTLLTTDKLASADWPRHLLAELHTMPAGLSDQQIVNTILYLARSRHIDRVVPLDEFDLTAATLLREHMRLPGLGQSKGRIFRDKLAMRSEARRLAIPVPEFTGVFCYDDLRAFMRSVPGPWLLKPRMNASAIGIKPISREDELWPILDRLGDQQSDYLLERFLPGAVFHVEGVHFDSRLLCSIPCAYGKPPIETMHQGGIFTTSTLDPASPDGAALIAAHQRLMTAFALPEGVTHTEFIRAHHDGQFYFLETAARVGGAYIADMVEFATGVNPWIEWARIEVARARNQPYTLAPLGKLFAGAIISLARQQDPDLSAYTDPEIVLRLHKPHHAGILVASPTPARTHELVTSYASRFLTDFCAVIPAPDHPTS